jgi:hypothetical protein
MCVVGNEKAAQKVLPDYGKFDIRKHRKDEPSDACVYVCVTVCDPHIVSWRVVNSFLLPAAFLAGQNASDIALRQVVPSHCLLKAARDTRSRSKSNP